MANKSLDRTITQAAAELGVSYSWVSKLIRRGEIAATGKRSRRGVEWRIPASEITRLHNERKAKSA